jgi:hypothetical protein
MRKDDRLRLIGFAVVVLLCVAVVFLYDDIVAWLSKMMVEQMDSMMDQLLR